MLEPELTITGTQGELVKGKIKFFQTMNIIS